MFIQMTRPRLFRKSNRLERYGQNYNLFKFFFKYLIRGYIKVQVWV